MGLGVFAVGSTFWIGKSSLFLNVSCRLSAASQLLSTDSPAPAGSQAAVLPLHSPSVGSDPKAVLEKSLPNCPNPPQNASGRRMELQWFTGYKMQRFSGRGLLW